eukprot:3281435-Prymnesium_polylepis.2
MWCSYQLQPGDFHRKAAIVVAAAGSCGSLRWLHRTPCRCRACPDVRDEVTPVTAVRPRDASALSLCAL